MDYEAMVKIAYEEITGIDKEAADELEHEDISRLRVEPNTKNYQIGNTTYDADENGRLTERKRPVKSQNVSVKKAYEEIMGFDKEAAGYAEGVATLGQKIDDAGKQRVLSNIADSKAARQSHTYANPKNVFDRAAGGINKATDSIGNAVGGKFGEKLVNFKPTGKQVAIGGGIAAGTLAAGLAAKKLHDKRKEKAEKAAAYYDEAQLAKEAAEADYAEACAYEEAALSILEELGYFED